MESRPPSVLESWRTREKSLQAEVREHVQAGSAIYTDALKSYEGMDEFKHQVVHHAIECVRGSIHTDDLEDFWGLVKRGLHATYLSVEPFHLFRYLDEQAYRFNNRKMNDGERFDLAVRQIVGKRLTWGRLTGESGAGSISYEAEGSREKYREKIRGEEHRISI